jgi:hypothetical protein
MLYAAWPLGTRSANRVYGLRIERWQAPDPTQPGYPNALARSALFDLQVRTRSDIRIEFARRLTWDLSRQQIGAPPTESSFALRLPLRRSAQADSLPSLP